MAVKFEVYDKAGTVVTTGVQEENGSFEATITGLTAGQVVATGDYQVAFVNDDNVAGTKADVPGFTVLEATPKEPTNVAATATDSGATVTASNQMHS